MPMPVAALLKTARNRASLSRSACSTSLRAAHAERLIRSCWANVRSRNARANPADSAPCRRATRSTASDETASPGRTSARKSPPSAPIE